MRKGEGVGDINGKLASENKLSWGEREGMRRRWDKGGRGREV